jgi:hypothetical protein
VKNSIIATLVFSFVIAGTVQAADSYNFQKQFKTQLQAQTISSAFIGAADDASWELESSRQRASGTELTFTKVYTTKKRRSLGHPASRGKYKTICHPVTITVNVTRGSYALALKEMPGDERVKAPLDDDLVKLQEQLYIRLLPAVI